MTVNEHWTLAADSFEQNWNDCDRCLVTGNLKIKRDCNCRIKRIHLIQYLSFFFFLTKGGVQFTSSDYSNPCPCLVLHPSHLHMYIQTHTHTSTTRRLPPEGMFSSFLLNTRSCLEFVLRCGSCGSCLNSNDEDCCSLSPKVSGWTEKTSDLTSDWETQQNLIYFKINAWLCPAWGYQKLASISSRCSRPNIQEVLTFF